MLGCVRHTEAWCVRPWGLLLPPGSVQAPAAHFLLAAMHGALTNAWGQGGGALAPDAWAFGWGQHSPTVPVASTRPLYRWGHVPFH